MNYRGKCISFGCKFGAPYGNNACYEEDVNCYPVQVIVILRKVRMNVEIIRFVITECGKVSFRCKFGAPYGNNGCYEEDGTFIRTKSL